MPRLKPYSVDCAFTGVFQKFTGLSIQAGRKPLLAGQRNCLLVSEGELRLSWWTQVFVSVGLQAGRKSSLSCAYMPTVMPSDFRLPAHDVDLPRSRA
ncbi:MAG TPA: hypothetical protein DD673_10270 [Lentisphaeria bacterium]|nr:hypothetical protein [Lentisphaeria bacterium]